MSPVTHFLSGWVFANCFDLHRRDRAFITWAAVIPDIDGVGIVVELATRISPHPAYWFSQYHHLLHNLWFALVCSVLAFVFAHRKWLTASLVFVAFHLHLLCDLVGSRGPDGYGWPIPYLWPISKTFSLSWAGEWPLNSWQNLLITVLLLVVSTWIIWAKHRSPIEPISTATDRVVVDTLLNRMQS